MSIQPMEADFFLAQSYLQHMSINLFLDTWIFPPAMGVRGINGTTETITTSRDGRRRPNVITRHRRRLKNYAIP